MSISRMLTATLAFSTLACGDATSSPDAEPAPSVTHLGKADSARVVRARATTPPTVRRNPQRHLEWLLEHTGLGRVMVRFEMPFTPEGDLSARSVRRQRERVRALQDGVLRQLGRSVRRANRFTITPGMSLTVDRRGYARLLDLPEVRHVRPDLPTPYPLAQSMPLIGGDIMQAGFGIDGTDAVIAITDTGIDLANPAFTGRIVGEACFSEEDEWAYWGPAALCPNGDDSQVGPGSAAACDVALCDHGTRVAGVAASDNFGTDGVAPGAGIFMITTAARFNDSDLIGDDNCGANNLPKSCVLSLPSNDINGLEHLCQRVADGMRVDVVNISKQGGNFSAACNDSDYRPVIDTLVSLGVVVVVPAGNFSNKNGVGEPACVQSAIAVGASTDNDAATAFTQSGPPLDLFAPGLGISGPDLGGLFATFSGTSFAGPHVAGAVALIRQIEPGANVAAIRAALTQPVGATMITDGATTRPRLNIPAAFNQIHPFPTVGIVTPQDGLFIETGSTITFKVTAAGVGVDDEDVVWAVNGTPFATGDDFDFTLTPNLFPVGNHDLTATLTDVDGLERTDTHLLRIYGPAE